MTSSLTKTKVAKLKHGKDIAAFRAKGKPEWKKQEKEEEDEENEEEEDESVGSSMCLFLSSIKHLTPL